MAEQQEHEDGWLHSPYSQEAEKGEYWGSTKDIL